jgi:hypothetical protein
MEGGLNVDLGGQDIGEQLKLQSGGRPQEKRGGGQATSRGIATSRGSREQKLERERKERGIQIQSYHGLPCAFSGLNRAWGGAEVARKDCSVWIYFLGASLPSQVHYYFFCK